MDISAATVKELRERTGVGFMDCKKALSEASGNLDEAVQVLRRMGIAKAAARSTRATSEGRIESYVHMGGKIAVLIEVNSETDFVARSDDFVQLARDLAMHVAAANPRFMRREDVDEATIERERAIFKAQAENEGKPPEIIERMVEGKLKRFYSEVCFYEQQFVREPDRKIGELITDAIARIGENIVVARFVRFGLGEGQAVIAESRPIQDS